MYNLELDVVLAALYERGIPRPAACSRRNLKEVARLWQLAKGAIGLGEEATSLKLASSSQPEVSSVQTLSELFYRHALSAEAAAIASHQTMHWAYSKCAAGSVVTCASERYPTSWSHHSGAGHPVLQIRESRPPRGYQSILKSENLEREISSSASAGPSEVKSRTPLEMAFATTFSKPFIALIGSRSIDASRKALVRAVAQASAAKGFTICSGGAPGTDRTAIQAVASFGPSFELWPCGISQRWGFENDMVDSTGLEPPIKNLPLIGSFVAAHEPFDRRHAMERNAALYSMAEAAFVAHARFKEGGSWHGAVTALRRRLCRVIVPMDGSPAHRSLVSLGAVPFDLSLPVAVALEQALEAVPLQPWLAFQIPAANNFEPFQSFSKPY